VAGAVQACIPFSRLSSASRRIVGCILLAKPILEAVYGPELVPRSQAFRVLIVAEVIFFFGQVAAATLLGLRLVRKAFLATGDYSPAERGACAVVLPRYGYNGAAWISLATELVGVGYLLWILRPALPSQTSIFPWRPAIQAAIASAPMAALVSFLRGTEIPVVLTSSGAPRYSGWPSSRCGV